MEKYINLKGNLYLCKKKINEYIKIIKENNKEDVSVFYYDIEQDLFEDFLEEFITTSLFFQTKVLVLTNLDKIKNIDNNTLENFTNNLVNNNDIYIFIRSKDDNLKKSVFNELIKKYFKSIEIKNPNLVQLKEYTLNEFNVNKYFIDDDACNLLLNKIKLDYERLDTEIKKIILYKNDDMHITTDDISHLVIDDIESDIFELCNSYLKKSSKNTIKIYLKLKMTNISPIVFISQLFKTLSLIYLAKKLLKRQYNSSNIAKYLNISPGQAYYIVNDSYLLNIEDVKKTIDDLSVLDYKIKNGEIDINTGVELFLLEK